MFQFLSFPLYIEQIKNFVWKRFHDKIKIKIDLLKLLRKKNGNHSRCR
ncbi:hypothetical protein HMPREF9444_00216 [Succinatimonas hippei YIT 12066]|uniref:Uncharacterized protein n=1 Tax=Succinatimonas hippei (strain DSM 22608 / JCM 16073 / KCTC 15190 / YIT 12066) TaxID=762983 RepID=E8LHP5_SUCHY|nr:hypothetical protein HMPREF9444_00216 [Succinatimonas hippei YIT 12066]